VLCGYFLNYLNEKQGRKMKAGALGKEYKDGEIIVRQGDVGECMYVIQTGKVEVYQETGDKEVRLAILDEGDFFGEMSIFEQEVRSASVKASGDVRVLTIDKKNFLRRIHEDPSLAFHIVKNMSKRIRQMDNKHTRIRSKDRRNWDNRAD
jgi:CRP-like cAMP-binding protein